MASIINAALSGGLVTTADTSGILQLQTAGTTALVVDASQNIGVGATPVGWSGGIFNPIQGSGGGAIAFRPNASNVDILSNAYYNGSNFIYQKTGYPALRYRIEDGGTFNWFTAPAGTAGNTITFTTALALGVGTALTLQNAAVVSGTGITFPSTQSASTDANTLDDYEEGTWTPVYSTNFTGTYSNQVGKYIKVGKLVTAYFMLQVSTVSGTGALQIKGLPFTSSSTTNYNAGTVLHLASNWGTNTPFSIDADGTSTVTYNLKYRSSANGTIDNTVNISDLSSNAFMRATLVYEASA